MYTSPQHAPRRQGNASQACARSQTTALPPPPPSTPPPARFQGITLLWTLLGGGHPLLGGVPLARRAIIVCPTSLVSNWDNECSKWLKVGRAGGWMGGDGHGGRAWRMGKGDGEVKRWAGMAWKPLESGRSALHQ